MARRGVSRCELLRRSRRVVLDAMTGGNLYAAAAASLFFPGFGQGLTFRRSRMFGFAVAALAATFAILWSVWFLPVTIAVHVAAAADAHRLLKRHATPGDRVLAAVAVVIGAIGVGYAGLSVEAFRIPSSSMYPTLVIGDHVYVDKLSPRWRPIERGEVIVFTQPCAQVPYVKRVIAVGGDTVEVRCGVVYVDGKAVESTLVAASSPYADYDEMDGRWLPRTASRYRETLDDHRYDVFHAIERPANERDGGRPDTHDFPLLDRMIAPSCRQNDFYPDRPGAPQPTGTLVVTKPGATACEPQAHFVVPKGALFVMGDNRNNANDSRYWGAVSTDAVIGRVIGIWMTAGGQTGRFSRFGALE